ncbi:hypothetical protein U9M48_009270 [Paspalum notatum var. saurae]|uniref:ENT domain-containing protein n=1 Tax=Paspalum notatum var. saurae TaxID=547442 RepID=A0AAQ3SQK4_PASNO
MGDSVQVACVIPDAADTEFQIRCLKRSAYAAVLRAFCAQSYLLSRAKEACLLALRNELEILEIEHRECLGKARSNKQINSLSAVLHSNGSICSTELRKDTPGLACALPDTGDTVLQIHCLEQSAYASVLRAFCAVTNCLSWLQVMLLTRLRNELRISHVEHTEALVKINSNENIKTLRKYSLANLSVITKINPEFDAHDVLHDKIGSPAQVSTSSTSCLSLAHQSPKPEHSMSSTRDIVISDSSNGAKEGPTFEPHAVVSAKRLKSVNGHALAYLKCAPSDLLPVAASMVMVKDRTDVTLESETLSYEMNSGCSSSPIVQENHSQLNAGQVSSCVDHARKESEKRKTEVPGMRVSPSLGVMDMDINCGIKCQRSKSRNKGSDLEHGSEVISIHLTANLLHKVERLLRGNQDAASLDKAKSMLKVRFLLNSAQEKDLLGALFKLSGVSYAVTSFSANDQPASINTHDDDKGDEAMLPKPVSSSDETLPGATRPGDGGAASQFNIQDVATTALSPSAATPTGGTASSSPVMPLLLDPPLLMQTRPHVPASPSSAPAALTGSSPDPSTAHPPHAQLMGVGSASAPPAPTKKRPCTKFTAEQKERMREFANSTGWSISKADAHAVDAFCAQVGVPRVVLMRWMNRNMGAPKMATPSMPSPPLPSHHQQDSPPAATPQGSLTTEENKSPEPDDVAALADGGKEDKNEASEVVIPQGMGRRAWKPNRRYGGPEWVSIYY